MARWLSRDVVVYILISIQIQSHRVVEGLRGRLDGVSLINISNIKALTINSAH